MIYFDNTLVRVSVRIPVLRTAGEGATLTLYSRGTRTEAMSVAYESLAVVDGYATCALPSSALPAAGEYDYELTDGVNGGLLAQGLARVGHPDAVAYNESTSKITFTQR